MLDIYFNVENAIRSITSQRLRFVRAITFSYISVKHVKKGDEQFPVSLKMFPVSRKRQTKKLTAAQLRSTVSDLWNPPSLVRHVRVRPFLSREYSIFLCLRSYVKAKDQALQRLTDIFSKWSKVLLTLNLRGRDFGSL